MKNTWGFVLTPQFLFGTLVAGLLLNVVAAYVVRAADRLWPRLTAPFRRALDQEAARIQRLSDAAATDSALYAALAAEASRLRLHQLLSYFISLVSILTFIFLVAMAKAAPGTLGVLGTLVAAGLLIFGFLQFTRGIDSGRRARRLDLALRAVHVSRQLPIMD